MLSTYLRHKRTKNLAEVSAIALRSGLQTYIINVDMMK
jgi:hypothetical protein